MMARSNTPTAVRLGIGTCLCAAAIHLDPSHEPAADELHQHWRQRSQFRNMAEGHITNHYRCLAFPVGVGPGAPILSKC